MVDTHAATHFDTLPTIRVHGGRDHDDDHDGEGDYGLSSLPSCYYLGPPYAAYTDVNAEASELRQYIGANAEQTPRSTPPARSTSRATSYVADAGPWTPLDAGLRPQKTGTHILDDDEGTTCASLSFGDLIREDAFCEPSRTATPNAHDIISTTTTTTVTTTTTTHAVAQSPTPPVLSSDAWLPANYRSIPVSAECLSPVVSHSDIQYDTASTQPLGRIRSLSKRDRVDTSGTTSGPARKPSKRHKQIPGGFACSGCNERFDRACDQAKHYKRTHAGDDSKSHSCSECNTMGNVKKFLYPKDLRRHLKQVHKIFTTAVTAMTSTEAAQNAAPPSPLSPGTSAFWTLTKAVHKFRNLRLLSTSPTTGHEEEKYIMVSTDIRNFQEVAVTGIADADALAAKILATLGLTHVASGQEVHAQSYSRKLGRVRLGDKLGRHGLLTFVTQAADSQGSLKLLIHKPLAFPHPSTAPRPMSTAEEFGMFRT